MIKLKLNFFGIFREYFDSEVIINFDKESNVGDLKNHLIENFFINDLDFLKSVFKKSLLVSDNFILNDFYILKSGDIINLLPPFSGG